MANIYGRFYYALELTGDVEIEVSDDNGSTWSTTASYNLAEGSATSQFMRPTEWCDELRVFMNAEFISNFAQVGVVTFDFLSSVDLITNRRDARFRFYCASGYAVRIRNKAGSSDLEAFGGPSDTSWVTADETGTAFDYYPKGVWCPPLRYFHDNRSYPVKVRSKTQVGNERPLYVQHVEHIERLHRYLHVPGEFVRNDALEQGSFDAGQPDNQATLEDWWENVQEGAQAAYYFSLSDAQDSGMSGELVYLHDPDDGMFMSLLEDVSASWGEERYHVRFKTRNEVE